MKANFNGKPARPAMEALKLLNVGHGSTLAYQTAIDAITEADKEEPSVARFRYITSVWRRFLKRTYMLHSKAERKQFHFFTHKEALTEVGIKGVQRLHRRAKRNIYDVDHIDPRDEDESAKQLHMHLTRETRAIAAAIDASKQIIASPKPIVPNPTPPVK